LGFRAKSLCPSVEIVRTGFTASASPITWTLAGETGVIRNGVMFHSLKNKKGGGHSFWDDNENEKFLKIKSNLV
jgi:hypothetical protein